MNLFGSLAYGLANLLHPRMLWLMLWPMLIAVGIWGTVAFALWARTALWLAGVFKQWLDSAITFLQIDFATATLFLANFLLVILFVPLVCLTALVILSIFGMQQMVDHVAQRSYPDLGKHRTGGVMGSGWNACAALIGMAALGLVSLPLWLIPPLWPLIPVLIFAWVNQRLLRYDALAEHADPEEMRQIFRERRGALYAMGLLLALVAYIPVVGFFAPVVFGLAFIHYLLGALSVRRLRSR
jgi:CysZ protein